MTPEKAAERFKWVKYDENTNTIELYLDNYMLSASRICESMFYLEHLLWLKPKYTLTLGETPDGKYIRRPWFFDFGEYVHWCLEQFYSHFKKHNNPPVVADWIHICRMKWALMKMDEYAHSIIKADVTKYNEVKGWEGVAGLLIQYYAFYMGLRARVIDIEITFGYNKEVPIGKYEYGSTKVECYLTGRIDLLVDNGYKIGPVDHKTTHKFDGYEHDDFNPHDGICGYILAIHEILKKYQAEGLTNIPQCNGGWIYHISSTTPSIPRDKTKQQGPRFKTTPVDKNQEQLDDYKARQLSTFIRIAELLFNDKTPEWNTTACNYMFSRKCQFKPIHEQPSSQWTQIINSHFETGQPWDTRDHQKKEEPIK